MSVDLNILTWNASGLMSSSSYLCDVLEKYNVDICGIAEHWLRSTDLHFFDEFDSNYLSYAVSDRDLCVPGLCHVRKGGVAIMWKRQFSRNIAFST